MSHRRFATAGMFLVLLALGCQEQQFRAETVWHPDGSISRTIYQSPSSIPDSAVFDESFEVLEVPMDQPGPLIDLNRNVSSRKKKQDIYRVARGEFASVAHLPDHVRIFASNGTSTAWLEREATVEEYGFVTEYRWREVLTDVVTFDDMVRARREAAEILADIALLIVRQDEQLDCEDFEAWLRNEGRNWFEEAHAAFVDFTVRRHSRDAADSTERFHQRMAEVAGRYGLELRDGQQRLLPQEQQAAAVRAYLIGLIGRTVRTHDGQAIDEQYAERILKQLGFNGETEERKQALLARFGSSDAAEVKRDELWTRLFGAHGPLSPPRPFRYEMTVPGVVVETNGLRLGDQQVRWRFNAEEAFPVGYVMECRSLLPDDETQQRVLGKVALTDVVRMTEFVLLLESDEELRDLLRQCIASESLTQLESHAVSTTGEARQRTKALLMLLR